MTRVAAIDCGTNSIRLLVSDISDGRMTDVVRRMEIVRLGEAVDRTGRLSPAALERTRKALADYAAQIHDLGAHRTRMVATSASRDAENADEFREMVLATLGVAPEVISGGEEAALSFTGAVRGLSVPGPYLVVDIGGGSTEYVTGTSTVDKSISVDVGCVRMTERHLVGDPPTGEQVRAATMDIANWVEKALAAVDGRAAATLVGLAGSVTTVTALALRLPAYQPERIHHARVTYADVAEVTRRLLDMTREQRLAEPVMHPGRADVIAAGALILQITMDRGGFDSVVASEHDILDGIAIRLA
jgi:exopolyphosphatase / guanosine-5'-triphosphate,3'-diphosphate pyrophosphatase